MPTDRGVDVQDGVGRGTGRCRPFFWLSVDFLKCNCSFVLFCFMHLLSATWVACVSSVWPPQPNHCWPSGARQNVLVRGWWGGQMLEAMALLHLVGTLATNSFAINQITFFRSPLASYIAHVCTIFGLNLFTRWLK